MAKSAPIKYEVRWRETGTAQWGPISSIDPTAEIVVEGLDRTKSYDFEVRAVSSCGARSAWVSSAQSIPDVGPNNIVLADVKAQADNAAADALAANQELANIASDNVLSQGEKPTVIRDVNVITAEQAGIDTQANAFGITTEKTAYDNAVSALTTYLATLTMPTLWSDLSGDTTIVGTTFRSKFQDVYTNRQTLLNAIYAAAKAKADAAQSTANTATGQVTQLPVINGGFDMTPTGYGWTADAGTGWVIDTSGATPGVGPNCAKRVAGTGSNTGAYRNNGTMAIQAGQVVKAQGLIKTMGVTGTAFVYISWLNASLSEIGTSLGNQVTGSTTAGSYAVGTAPTGAYYARVCLGYNVMTAGTVYVDNVLVSQYPSSQDEVPDGPTYSRVLGAQVNNGVVALLGTGRNPIYNPTFTVNSLGTAVNANVNSGYNYDGWNVTATGTYATTIHYSGAVATRILGGFAIPNGYANGPTIQSNSFAVVAGSSYAFRASIAAAISGTFAPAGVTFYQRVILQFLDATGGLVANEIYDVPFTSSYAQGTNTYTGTVPSGAVSANVQLSMYTANTGSATVLPGTTSNYIDCDFYSLEYVQQTDLSNEVGGTLASQRRLPLVTWGNYGGGWSGLSITYTTTTTSCTFSASSGSYVGGGDSIAYNSGSVTVSGSAGSTVTYYLYYDDPGMTGGSKSLQATTDQITSLNAAGRVLLGKATVTYPTSGTGGGGGGTGCPQVDEPVIRRAPDGSEEVIRAGEVSHGDYLLLSSGRWGFVSYSETKLQPGVRVVGSDGSTITCSASAPLETVHGTCVRAPHVRDLALKHRRAGVMRVVEVFDVGDIWVQHITCEDDCFWVGDYSHHNLKPLNP